MENPKEEEPPPPTPTESGEAIYSQTPRESLGSGNTIAQDVRAWITDGGDYCEDDGK